MRNIIKFNVELDSKGFTIENLENFTDDELALIIKILPSAVREVKAVLRHWWIKRRLLELEAKTVWTAKESIFYAAYSPKLDAFDTACDRFNLFKEIEAIS